MEAGRHVRRGRASRSTREANKENICPLDASLVAAEISGSSRRSPLPLGFPRSPLQDITHIIYPPNIWAEEDEPHSAQLHKKCKTESLEDEPVQTAELSWQGLKSCVHHGSKTMKHQAEEVALDQANTVMSPVHLESSSEASRVYLVGPQVHVSNMSLLCENSMVNDVTEGDDCLERGRFVSQANCFGSLDVVQDGVLHSLPQFDGCSSNTSQTFFVHRDEAEGAVQTALFCKSSVVSTEREGKCSKWGGLAAQSQSLANAKSNGLRMDEVQRVLSAGENADMCIDKGKAVAKAQFLQKVHTGARSQVRVVDQANSLVSLENCEAGHHEDSLNAKARCMRKPEAQKVNHRKFGPSVQVKKKSTLSMLR